MLLHSKDDVWQSLLLLHILYIFLAELFPDLVNYVYCCSNEADIEAFKNRIVETRTNVQYFKDQLVAYDHSFKEAILTQNTEEMNESRVALKEAQTNLNSEQRLLRILENRLSNGDFSDLNPKPITGKRGFEE